MSLYLSCAAPCVGVLLVLLTGAPTAGRAQTVGAAADTTTAPVTVTDSATAVTSAPDPVDAITTSAQVTAGVPIGDPSSVADTTTRAGAAGRLAPPWLPPSPAEEAARHPVLPSVRDGLALTPDQEAAMEAARAPYREQLQALAAQLQAAADAHADTTALADGVRQATAAQRDAVLAVLTAAQRAQYDANVQRAQAIQAEHQP